MKYLSAALAYSVFVVMITLGWLALRSGTAL